MQNRNRFGRNKRHPLMTLQVGEVGTLNQLQIGQKARVLSIYNDNCALRRHLLDMGITKGVEVKIKKIAPMGDPVDIELRGYELCIRRHDMKHIDIEVIES